MPSRALVAVSVALAFTLATACAGRPPVTDAGRVNTPVSGSTPVNGTAAGTVPNSTSLDRSTTTVAPTPIAWKPCKPVGYECGTVTVPIDYDHPDGATLDLAVKRHPAGDPSRRIGSVFVNPGGPGGSGLEALPGIAGDLGDDVATRFDVVSWDPRGVGQSSPLTCEAAGTAFYEEDLSKPRPDPSVDKKAKAWAGQCASENGALLPFVGTADVARDLDRLRAAVGDEKLTYAGYSYGTLIGLVYSELFGDNVRAMILDGVVDPSLDPAASVSSQAAAVERALDKFVAWCKENASCAVRADPQKAIDTALEQSRTRPLTGTIDGKRVRLSSTLTTLAIVTATYDSDAWPILGRALDSVVNRRDTTALSALADAYLSSANEGLNLAVGCLDSPTPKGDDYDKIVDQTVQAAPDIGAVTANLGRPCEFWSVPPKPLPSTYRAARTPPIMVWGTTGDNATPYENAVRVSQMLTSAHLMTLDGDRHTALGANDCVTRLQGAYLIDLDIPAAGTRC